MTKKDTKPFKITSVARADLKELGFDTSKVEDGTMEDIAEQMGEAYVNSGFWEQLETIANSFELPKL